MKPLIILMLLALAGCAELTAAFSEKDPAGDAGTPAAAPVQTGGETPGNANDYALASGADEGKSYPRPKERPLSEPAAELTPPGTETPNIAALLDDGDRLKGKGDYDNALIMFKDADGTVIKTEGIMSAGRLPVVDRIIHTAFLLGEKTLAKEMARTKERIINANADAWAQDSPEGGIRHKQSGIIFPDKFGSLDYSGRNAYRIDGSEVSQGYRSANRRLTIYVSPGNKSSSFDSQFVEAVETIEAQFPSLTKVRDDQIDAGTYGKAGPGRIAVFKFLNPVEDQNYWTSLALFKSGNQFVKLRFTYPENEAMAASRDVRLGMSQLVWPKGGNSASKP